MLGLFDRFMPSFVKQYARLGEEIVAATTAYVEDVRTRPLSGWRQPRPSPEPATT